MEIVKDGLSYKAYVFGTRLRDLYQHGGKVYRHGGKWGEWFENCFFWTIPGRSTNICEFVKTAVFSTLFIICFQILTCLSAITALLLPFYLFTFISVVSFVGIGLLIIGGPLALVYITIRISDLRPSNLEPFIIMKTYIKAIKNKFCPIVTFVEKSK